MSRFFEVHQREGAGRIGTLMLKSKITTPTILDVRQFGDLENSSIIYPGNLWGMHGVKNTTALMEEIREKADDNALIIYPSRSYPPEIAEKCDLSKPSNEKIEGPVGIAFSEDDCTFPKDLYILDGAGTFDNKSRKLFQKIVDIRNKIPEDSVLYAPNIATPENLSMLIFLGIDAVDNTRALVAAGNNIYFTPAGAFHLDSLTELPCGCPACKDHTPSSLLELEAEERKTLLENHNNTILESEIAICREMIRKGSLREYVEGKCRSQPWLTALLRHADSEYDYIESQTPISRRAPLLATTSESLTRPEVVRFAKRVQERYVPPEKDILLLLPCSAKKPYSISLSHSKFIRALGKNRKYVQELILTSPMGIVPRELEIVYPAAHYDTTVTGYWDAEEQKWVESCLEKFLEKHHYKHIIAHVDGEYREICEEVTRKTGIEFVYTAEGSCTTSASLKKLEATLNGIDTELLRKGDWRKDTLRAIADYQFGSGAGNLLVQESDKIKAPYPKHQVFAGKTQVATLVPQYGLMALGLEGVKRIIEMGNYIVHIDDFVPRGSILAPGVTDADPDIRPLDEVIVVGEKAMGVGRAFMSGKEMKESARGIAVDLRHVKKL
ncbi:archaeosine synthase [Methanohalophilus levihalophilus]|uniref:archaeosine synthase subunit alpha n=1 Tax=Methanohalophilus levihalophilus TaxID=1431282 RepID=UPI001AE5B0BB|nr:archaeosine synthase subunit alpha [Methanohalophilus levihalophilus]MBP2029828.1 archaeosine synthase [Methanohalophilus levihalophilus]